MKKFNKEMLIEIIGAIILLAVIGGIIVLNVAHSYNNNDSDSNVVLDNIIPLIP